MAVNAAGWIYMTLGVGQRITLFRPGQGIQDIDTKGLPAELVFWPDQGTLVVPDHLSPYIWAYRVEKDGQLTAGEEYYKLRRTEKQRFKGTWATVDTLGRLYVTSEQGVQIFDPTGRLCGVLTDPERNQLSHGLCLGGKDFDQLFLAMGKNVYARKINAKGVPPTGLKPPAK
jgi:enterochelin esterase family protein